MILKSEHPWANFLHARALAIEWLKDGGNNFEEIAEILSMDEMQVRLIYMTPVEK